jgi:hypothetical protein
MTKRRIITLILILLLVLTLAGTAFGAYLTYKSYVEIYGDIHPLGEVEIDIKQMSPIEGLEAREDYLGQIRVWTYSNDTELILQLAQVSQIVSNFREFTIKIFQPLDMIFVIDITGTMPQYMDKIKTQLNELIFLLSMTHKAPLKFGVVGFKDYPAETIKLPLTDNYETVKTYINNLAASGGGHAPQSHYLGLQTAKNEFNTNSKITNERVVVFFSDAQAGKDDAASFTEAKAEADEMAELGIKIDAVLCGSDTPPQNEQLQYYAKITGGQYIGPEGEDNISNGVRNHVTWKIMLTPITPFDSFQLRLASSPPCQKKGYYTFYVYVSFYANAVPWHDTFFVELMANLEKGESPWSSNTSWDPPDPGPPHNSTSSTGLAKLQDELIDAPTHTVYFIYQDPKCMRRPESAFDVMSGGIVYGLCTNSQNQGFNTTKYWLLPTGAINTTTIHDATIAMFGGTYPQVSVKYYVNAGITPIDEAVNSTHVIFQNRTGYPVASLAYSVVGKGHEDLFLIEVFEDESNFFVVMYGVDWLGTWAAGMYFKEEVYPNLASYTHNYYIFHWIDDPGQDGVPQASEIILQASG